MAGAEFGPGAMRALKAAVIIMGVLIVVGTTALVVVIVQRLSTGGPSTAEVGPARTAAVLDEPAGTRIAGLATSGDRLVLQLRGGGADRIVVVDLRSLAVIGRIGLAH